jgi:hypothetical protein
MNKNIQAPLLNVYKQTKAIKPAIISFTILIELTAENQFLVVYLLNYYVK